LVGKVPLYNIAYKQDWVEPDLGFSFGVWTGAGCLSDTAENWTPAACTYFSSSLAEIRMTRSKGA
jgi:hypothetical protein